MVSSGLVGVYAPLAAVIQRGLDEWNRKYGAILTAVVVQGSRFYSQELIYYLQGRGLPGPIVTRALPEQSMHVPLKPGDPAYAVDVGFRKADGSLDYTPAHYAVFAQLVPELEWGGRWQGDLVDEPHFEVKNYSWSDRLAGKPPPSIP